MDPHAVVRWGEEEDCQAAVPAQAIFARASREELQSGSTLVRESSMPVGSAISIEPDHLLVLACSSPYPLSMAAHIDEV